MTTTSPWVSIFSRFTSEALLFEALIIFSLAALYTGFWLVRKRKFGVIEKQVPAGVVKYYLNELIVDAEELRAQLFGMLTGHGVPATPLANVNFSGVSAGVSSTGMTTGTSHDASSAAVHAGGSLSTLEAKLAEQAKQIESFTSEKARIERELLEAKAATQSGAAPANNGDAAAMAKLHEKIAILEGKLAEYSVIEDDLANLKRLQQENAALKAQLAAKGGALPASTATATPSATATATASAAAAAATSTTAAAAAAEAADNALAQAAAATENDSMAAVDNLLADIAPVEAASTSTTPNVDEALAAAAVEAAQTPGAPDLASPLAEAEAGTLEGGFEGLVDQVEQSLQPTETPETAAAAKAAAREASTKAAPAATIEKSDADLVSEFEKMLNG
jgi:hypothetical protein